MKKLLLISLILAVIGCSAALLAGGAKDTIVLKSKKGDVTLTHKAHNDKLGAGKCNTCHHTSKADGSDAGACTTCHKEKESEKDGKKVPSVKDAMHKMCKDCHAKNKGDKVPTAKCDSCHKK
jgi:hypothetical protein